MLGATTATATTTSRNPKFLQPAMDPLKKITYKGFFFWAFKKWKTSFTTPFIHLCCQCHHHLYHTTIMPFLTLPSATPPLPLHHRCYHLQVWVCCQFGSWSSYLLLSMELFLLKDIYLAFVKHEVTCLIKKKSLDPQLGELVPRQVMLGEGGGGVMWVWAAGVAAHILCKYF